MCGLKRFKALCVRSLSRLNAGSLVVTKQIPRHNIERLGSRAAGQGLAEAYLSVEPFPSMAITQRREHGLDFFQQWIFPRLHLFPSLKHSV